MYIDSKIYKTIGRSNVLETPKPVLLLLFLLITGISIIFLIISEISIFALLIIIPILTDMRVFTRICPIFS